MLAKGSEEQHETTWAAERRRRYEFLAKFRKHGGMFDVKYLLGKKKHRRGEGKEKLKMLSKALKCLPEGVTSLPSEVLLARFDV